VELRIRIKSQGRWENVYAWEMIGVQKDAKDQRVSERVVGFEEEMVTGAIGEVNASIE
jgi:hypothetical protein